MKFHHIGIFVRSLHIGRDYLSELLLISNIGEEFIDEKMGIYVQFLTDNCGITYEIIAPYGEINPVQNLLTKKKNILNHVAYQVENLDDAIIKYRSKGCIPLGIPSSAVAFHGKKVVFFLTKIGIIIELIEA
jgi:methylmalonyl-CoA/ethylmalonyl-CoA epimerase